MGITEKDYTKIMELLTMKKVVPLDLTRGALPDELEDEIDESIELNFENNFQYYGNLTSHHMFILLSKMNEEEKADFWKNRFKVFKDENGNPALEVSFIPGEPIVFDEDEEDTAHADAIWRNTRLSEIMDYDTYISDVSNYDADWVLGCFGEGGEAYGVLVEIIEEGAQPGGILNYDPVLELPIRFEYDGISYEMRVASWSS